MLLHGVARLRGGGLPRPALLRLTRPRLVVLTHYALQPDRVLELPRAAVRAVTVRRGVLRLTWTAEDGGQRVTRLTRWTGRPAFDTPVQDVAALADVLVAWLAAPGG